ncbi:hypothetical protein [Litorimonas sp. WD9-15]|uniref:hypothetical protein n=1 Tax=Litorimonas sp. WD9-15 TaxID=3418716 RepID=UPI003CFFC441
MRSSLLAILFFGACTTIPTNSTPSLFIGEITKVELLFGEPYRSNWPVTKKQSHTGEDDIIVSNACGYAKATFRNVNSSKNGDPQFLVGETIGEWCENPFRSIEHHKHYLILPLTKNKNRPWHKGTYKSVVMPIYEGKFGYYADPYDIIYADAYDFSREDEYFAFTETLRALDLYQYLEAPVNPIVIRRLEGDETITLDAFEQNIYAVEDRNLLLINALKIDHLYAYE